MFPSFRRSAVLTISQPRVPVHPGKISCLPLQLIAISISLSVIGCGKGNPPPQPVIPTPEQVQAVAIARVLADDRQQSSEAQTFEEIPQKMRQIDLSGCPNEFKAAYLTHIHAWESAVQIVNEFKQFQQESNSGGVILESMLRGALGDPFGKSFEIMQANQDLQKRFQKASEEIQTSYRRLEEVAVLFGAQPLPPMTADQ